MRAARLCGPGGCAGRCGWGRGVGGRVMLWQEAVLFPGQPRAACGSQGLWFSFRSSILRKLTGAALAWWLAWWLAGWHGLGTSEVVFCGQLYKRKISDSDGMLWET